MPIASPTCRPRRLSLSPAPQLAAHSLFVETWKALDLSSVVGFPAWEEEVFVLLQPVFEQVSAIFFTYARAVGAAAGTSSATLDETMQENELVALVRDTGLATDAFPIARILTLYVQVTTSADQLTLPGFVKLLFLIAIHRANPKLGSAGNEHAVEKPLPQCLETLLTKHILKGVKKEQQAALKADIKAQLDLDSLFKTSRAALKQEFESACRTREKGRSLFGGLVMSCPTLVAECQERKLLGGRLVTPRSTVVGASTADVEVALSAADVQRAFVSCQDGGGGEEGNTTINFDEFLMCLTLCGQVKYAAVAEMTMEQKVSSLVATYLGERDDASAIGNAIAPKFLRFDASQVVALPGHSAAEHELWMSTWRGMDLSKVHGFPLWEREVFEVLHSNFVDLYGLFSYYAWSADGADAEGYTAATMQQGELVDLALDCALATKAFPMTKIVATFDEVNRASPNVNSDLECSEFFHLLVVLAHARANAEGPKPPVSVPAAVETLIHDHLSRTQRLEDIAPLVTELKADMATTAVLRVHEQALRSFFTEAVPYGPLMDERAFLKQLSAASLMKGVIVPLPTGRDARCDLTWLDASAAFHACASSEAGMLVGDYATCLALCGMIKFRNCSPMTAVQKVAGFLANLAGRMDEHDVLKTSLANAPPPPTPPPPQPTGSAPPLAEPGVKLPMKVVGAAAFADAGAGAGKSKAAGDAKGVAGGKRAPSPRGARPPSPRGTPPAGGARRGAAAAPSADEPKGRGPASSAQRPASPRGVKPPAARGAPPKQPPAKRSQSPAAR